MDVATYRTTFDPGVWLDQDFGADKGSFGLAGLLRGMDKFVYPGFVPRLV
jgi:hypothetical protein